MQIKTLGFSKQEVTSDECVYDFGFAEWPVVFSSKMRFDKRLCVPNTRLEADVSFWSFCWENTFKPKTHLSNIRNSTTPYCFIVSKIESIVDIDLDGENPHVTYETMFHGERVKMTLYYPSRDDDDEPITDTFSHGDIIIGLFKAKVKILN